MNGLDWKIQKRLLDVGGLGPVVYYIPARGVSRLSDVYRILELRASGRTVVYVRPQDSKKLLGARQPWVMRDRDVLTPERYERADRIFNEYWRGKRNETVSP